MADLERELGATKNTVRRHLQPMLNDGTVESVAHWPLSDDGKRPGEFKDWYGTAEDAGGAGL